MVLTDDLPQLALRPRQAARALSISLRHLWQLTKNGDIPHVRIGHGARKTILYPISSLQTWLAQNTAQPRPCGKDAGADPMVER